MRLWSGREPSTSINTAGGSVSNAAQLRQETEQEAKQTRNVSKTQEGHNWENLLDSAFPVTFHPYYALQRERDIQIFSRYKANVRARTLLQQTKKQSSQHPVTHSCQLDAPRKLTLQQLIFRGGLKFFPCFLLPSFFFLSPSCEFHFYTSTDKIDFSLPLWNCPVFCNFLMRTAFSPPQKLECLWTFHNITMEMSHSTDGKVQDSQRGLQGMMSKRH